MKFDIKTPLGFTVRTTDEYWQKLLVKHPDLADLEELVEAALQLPDEIRESKRDSDVFLFYLQRREKRWVVAVARRLNGLITIFHKASDNQSLETWLQYATI